MKATYYLRLALRRRDIALQLLKQLPRRVVRISKERGMTRGIGYLLYYLQHYSGLPFDKLYWLIVKLIVGGKVVKTRVLDFDMYVDLDDHGISRQLWIEGIREHGAVSAYKKELLHLQEVLGAPLTILEAGSNIGYYTLMAYPILKEVRIFAVEPAPDNVQLLLQNIKLNGIEGKVDVTQGALSERTGKMRLFLSDQSNVHSMEYSRSSRDYIDVPTWSIDDFLQRKGLEPKDVHVLRMDTEGHELSILLGAKRLLMSSTPLLCFIEFHDVLLKNGRIYKMISLLKEHGFRVSYGCVDYFTGTIEEFWSLDDLPNILQRHSAAEVFLRRGF